MFKTHENIMLQVFKKLLPSHLEIIELTNLWLKRKNYNLKILFD
jgi:hypothetical protein